MISLIYLIYYLTAPSLLTTLSILLLITVWADFGMNLMKNRESNETLTKDERMKVVYADYVYLVTYMESIMVTIILKGLLSFFTIF